MKETLRRRVAGLLAAVVLLSGLLCAPAHAQTQREWDLGCRMKVRVDTDAVRLANYGETVETVGVVKGGTYCRVKSARESAVTGVTYLSIEYREDGEIKTATVAGSAVVSCMYLYAGANGLPVEYHELLAPAGGVTLGDGSGGASSGAGESADDTWTYFVKEGGATLRLQAAESSAVISTHAAGTRVTVISSGGEWAAVVANGQQGFMKMSELTRTPGQAQEAPGEQTVMYVRTQEGGALKLRKNASSDAPVLGRYENGAQVTVYSRYNGWAYAVTQDGQAGYMLLRHLSQDKDAPPASADAETSDGVTKYIDTLGEPAAILYGTTGVGSAQVGQCPNGARVTAYPTQGEWSGWCYITMGGAAGFVLSKYLSDTRPAGGDVPEDGRATVMFIDAGGAGKTAPLYETASTGAKVLGRYEHGLRVQVWSSQAGWAYLSTHNAVGYMQTSDLTPADGGQESGEAAAGETPLTEAENESGEAAAAGETPSTKAENESGEAAAAGQGIRYVHTGNDGRLHLRQRASKTSRSLGLYENGTAVTVLAHEGDFAKVRVDGKEGYMMSSMLATGAASGGQAAGESAAGERIVRTGNDGRLHLRQRASKTSRSLGLYENGTAVTVLAESRGWAQVTVGGRNGYMLASCLAVREQETSVAGQAGGSAGEEESLFGNGTQPGGETAGQESGETEAGETPATGAGQESGETAVTGETPSTEAEKESGETAAAGTGVRYVYTGNDGRLHLRTEARASAASMGLYENGAKVTVLAQAGEWSQVQVNGRTGYMLTRCLSAQSPAASAQTTPGKTCYVKTEDGGRLHLRERAQKTARSLGLFENGAAVTVVSAQNGWAKVKVNGQTGYMLEKYLTQTAPAQGE